MSKGRKENAPPLGSWNPRAVLDRIARRLGYVPAGDHLRLEGHVYARVGEGPEIYIGPNVLTRQMRVNAARLLARTAVTWPHGPVSYAAGVEGLTWVDPAFPAYLAVGTGVTAATAQDWTMVSPLLSGGSTAYYPLQSVTVYDTPGAYDPNPISVSFFFNIPAGEAWDGVGTDVTIAEWALFNDNPPPLLLPPTDPEINQNMLARRVRSVTKVSDLDLTVRWELRT